MQVSVRKHNGTLNNLIVDPLKKKITLIREQFYADVDESTVQETDYDLDDNGEIFTTLIIAKNESSFSLKVNSYNRRKSRQFFPLYESTIYFGGFRLGKIYQPRNGFGNVLHHTKYSYR